MTNSNDAADPGAMERAFSDPVAVARYREGPPRFVPGVDALDRMAGVLLAERVPDDATILVLGAGGGREMAAMTIAQPGWRFVGVDPSREMLELARATLGADAARAELVEGLIDHAPSGPFDGAVCLLTLHFLEAAERVRTVRAIYDRLVSGAPFVAAHCSVARDPRTRAAWFDRYMAFAVASGADPDQARTARDTVASTMPILSPEQDEAVLRDGGFRDVELFYAAFTWRGWSATA